MCVCVFFFQRRFCRIHNSSQSQYKIVGQIILIFDGAQDAKQQNKENEIFRAVCVNFKVQMKDAKLNLLKAEFNYCTLYCVCVCLCA